MMNVDCLPLDHRRVSVSEASDTPCSTLLAAGSDLGSRDFLCC